MEPKVPVFQSPNAGFSTKLFTYLSLLGKWYFHLKLQSSSNFLTSMSFVADGSQILKFKLTILIKPSYQIK